MRIGNWNLRHKIFNIKNFSYCAPLIIPIIITILSYKLSLIHSCSKGLESLFSNIINAFAIIIGVLIALFGVLPSMSDSLVMKRIKEYKAEKELFYFCTETLVLSFLSLFLTLSIGFINSNYNLQKYNYIFYVWLFLICWTLSSSFRTILSLLKISFLSSSVVIPEVKRLDKDKSRELKNKYLEEEEPK
ncbi:hypothetical protein HO831_07055 [Streptococcus suis]|uniref:Uncharacterized protein n=2 Tax=Streptococcus suis TaxID=1307 RepID=A0A822VMQ1_STRSU|nr:hypothetical protein [Streptococcus suis]AGZ22157.1 hypothetical protein T15_0036 [Streptococcus suis T15]MBO8083965.1 hypothetical protein [Streptococcus suis]MBS8078054.1 hypothetical protein [Streptococcus suis]MCB2883997.1 hypothetical protein [Streptococcus suis]MCB2892094.1 hypothetical protein [Streptococcus suis]